MAIDAGSLIREARRRAGLSQAQLAERAGVAQPVISAYETGRREPGLAMLEKLVRASGHRLQFEIVDEPASGRGPRRPGRQTLLAHRDAILAVAQRTGASDVRTVEIDGRTELLVDLGEDVRSSRLLGLQAAVSYIVGARIDVRPAESLTQEAAADAIPL